MPKLKLVITGFGPFPGVARNPTQELLEDVRNLVEQGTLVLPDGVVLEQAATLRVAARDVWHWEEATIEQLQGSSHKSGSSSPVSRTGASEGSIGLAQQAQECGDGCAVLTVHMGVDATSECFKLERYAYNNASFRVPDLDGWTPSKVALDPSLPLDQPLCTRLDLDRAVDQLRNAAFRVRLSSDPGRYLCNLTYYLSLAACAGCLPPPPAVPAAAAASSNRACAPNNATHAADAVAAGVFAPSEDVPMGRHNRDVAAQGQAHGPSSPRYALFVHVPPFAAIPQDAQRQFMAALLTLLCKQVLADTAGTKQGMAAKADTAAEPAGVLAAA